MKIKINLKKLKKSLNKIPKFLIDHILLIFAFCFACNIFIGLFIFYQYSFLVEIKEIKTEKKLLPLKEEVLKDILQELDKKEQRFQETEFREYPDLFKIREIVTGD